MNITCTRVKNHFILCYLSALMKPMLLGKELADRDETAFVK